MKIQCPRINRLGNQCKEYVWSPTENKLLCHRCIKTDSGKLYQEKLRLEGYYQKVVLGNGAPTKGKTPASLPKLPLVEPKPKAPPKEADDEGVESEGEPEYDSEDDQPEPEEVKEEILKPSIALETKYRHAIEAVIAQGEKDYIESLKPKSSKGKAAKAPKVEKAKPAKKEKKIVEVPSDDEVDEEGAEYLDEDVESDEGDSEGGDPLAELDSPAMDEKVQRYTKHAIRLTGITVEQFLRNKYGVDLPGFAHTLAEEPEMQEAVNEMVKEYATTDIAEFVDQIPPWAKLAIVGGSVAAHCYSKGKGSSVVFPLPSQIVSEDNRTEVRGDKLLAAITPDLPVGDDSLLAPDTPQD